MHMRVRGQLMPPCGSQMPNSALQACWQVPYPLSISLALRNSQTPVTRLYPEPNTTKQLGSEAKTPASPLLSRQFQCAAGVTQAIPLLVHFNVMLQKPLTAFGMWVTMFPIFQC